MIFDANLWEIKRVFNSLNRMENTQINLRKDYMINLHSTKSAIAAIMSRNVSHNLGSHVIYYIKNAIQGFEQLQTSPSLAELERTEEGKFELRVLKSFKKEFEIVIEQDKAVKAPFLRGLIRFLNYIQERHDFIATVSSDYIPYVGSVNFKDFIFDVILPDKRIGRHKQGEDLAKYQEQNILHRLYCKI